MKRREFLIGTTSLILAPSKIFSFQSSNNIFSNLEGKLRNLKWIAYSPTNYNPEKSVWPSEDSIKKDIDVLLKARIQGIVTYGANNGLKNIPKIAKEKGIEGVVMGIWDLNKNSSAGQKEWDNACNAKNFVDGYCVGNEGLLDFRYHIEDLKKYINDIKSATGKPATTSERWYVYVLKRYDLFSLDWVFPIIHPYWDGIKNAQEGVAFTVDKYNLLASGFNGLFNGKFVMTKECGFPTKGDPQVNESLQKNYYERLLQENIEFCFFEAFDQPWKTWKPVEPYWGLWDKKRNPKKVVSVLLKSGVEDWNQYQ